MRVRFSFRCLARSAAPVSGSRPARSSAPRSIAGPALGKASSRDASARWLMAAIVAALRLREAEERRRVIQRIADNFTPSPPGVCAHCGEGARVADPFVLLFANDDRADIHSSCHSAWWAKRFGNGAWVAKKLQGVRSVTSAAM